MLRSKAEAATSLQRERWTVMSKHSHDVQLDFQGPTREADATTVPRTCDCFCLVIPSNAKNGGANERDAEAGRLPVKASVAGAAEYHSFCSRTASLFAAATSLCTLINHPPSLLYIFVRSPRVSVRL
jgi:hypothetical protein